MIAESDAWIPIVVVSISVVVPAISGMLMFQLKNAKDQAARDAELIRLDSVKHAKKQTEEHDTVAQLLRVSIENGNMLGHKVDMVQFDTHEIRTALRGHLESQNPHPKEQTNG